MAWRRWILVLAMLPALESRLVAGSAEQDAFEAAAKAFNDTFYDWAEGRFADFARKYPGSTNLPKAILLQAEARFALTNYAGAIELLTTRQSQAGEWADQYFFWLGQAYFNNNNLQTAAETFGKLIKEFPSSSRRLEAAIGEAAARAKLGQWPQVIQLLSPTNGVFQTAARAETAKELAPAGYLLLGEAHLALKDYRAAEAALQPLAHLALNPTNSWAQQYLLCRIQLADGRAQEALENTTNLLALAAKAARRDLQAASAAFQAGVFERLGETDQAILAYQKNLPAGFPAERRRQALLKVTELFLAQNKISEAAQMLEGFLSEYPQAPMTDLALLTLGELRLRQREAGEGASQPEHGATNAPATNYLQQAAAAFSALTNNLPQSPLVGKAELDLGWCFWLDGRMAQSEEAFQAAVQRLLPLSAEQGRAYFKLADAQFRQKRFTEAIANYTSLVSRFASLEEVKSNLFEPALYQTVQAGLAAGDLAAATNALAKILAWYPDSFVTGSALLMTGQAISRHGDPAGARALFLGFSTNAPSSALLPVVKLAIARTYEMENNWDAAIQQYDVWLDTFTNHQARASAEYYRAWANDAAGRQTNALRLFTNFVARFPASPLTPRAQWWVADYYFRLGDTNYLEAEKNYQLVFLNTNLSPSPLKFRAIMMAGQAAVGRSSWEDAMKYFTNLTSDLNCPADLRAQALFAYGDYWTSRESTNKLADYAEAIKVFSEIGQSYPTNHLAVLALGRMASCLLQLKQFEAASNTYQQVIVSPLADATTRSRAKVGLAIVLEKEAEGAGATERIALLKGALNQCLDVVLAEGQEPDPFWMKEAGLKAGKLAEAMEDWETAIKVYKKLSELLPALRPSLEERRLKAEKHLEERWKLSG